MMAATPSMPRPASMAHPSLSVLLASMLAAASVLLVCRFVFIDNLVSIVVAAVEVVEVVVAVTLGVF